MLAGGSLSLLGSIGVGGARIASVTPCAALGQASQCTAYPIPAATRLFDPSLPGMGMGSLLGLLLMKFWTLVDTKKATEQTTAQKRKRGRR